MTTIADRRRVVRLLALAAAIGVAVRLTLQRRRDASTGEEPADVSFVRAMHDAFRRDLKILHGLARGSNGHLPTDELDRHWSELCERLHRHHRAEDEDLWPVVRPHLSIAEATAIDRHDRRAPQSRHRDGRARCRPETRRCRILVTSPG